jgi:catechol 2,3-dioxygenase
MNSAGLPAGTRVGGVRLQVSDLGRSLAFYRDTIGLRTIGETGDAVVLGAPGSAEPLVRLQAVPGTHPARRRGSFGLFHFAILLPDRTALGRFVVHLAARGVRAGMSDHLVSEAVYLSDPDGLGIEVYADRPGDTWPRAGGRLAMATDPLDVEDLAAAAGGAAWDGVPTKTTIGHLHLHVGDLVQAEAFYARGLGFDVTVRDYPGALFFAAGGYHHHLGANVWAPGPAPGADQARLLEWTIVVPAPAAARAAGERLRGVGATVLAEGDDAIVTDPWGTRLRLTA